MTDIPYAVSVGRAGEHLLLDLNYIEDSGSDSDMPVAIGPRKNDVNAPADGRLPDTGRSTRGPSR